MRLFLTTRLEDVRWTTAEDSENQRDLDGFPNPQWIVRVSLPNDSLYE